MHFRHILAKIYSKNNLKLVHY